MCPVKLSPYSRSQLIFIFFKMTIRQPKETARGCDSRKSCFPISLERKAVLSEVSCSTRLLSQINVIVCTWNVTNGYFQGKVWIKVCEERGSRQQIVWKTKYFYTEVSINIKQRAKTFLCKTKVEILEILQKH